MQALSHRGCSVYLPRLPILLFDSQPNTFAAHSDMQADSKPLPLPVKAAQSIKGCSLGPSGPHPEAGKHNQYRQAGWGTNGKQYNREAFTLMT